MRVALLQLALDSKSPSSNTQVLIGGIHRAAKTAPAPDLLALPGACDTGGTAPSRRLCDARMQGTCETLAWQARDWGVYIAAGLHERRGSALLPCAVLFDPDGDVVAHDLSKTGDAGSVGPIPTWQTAIGALGVLAKSPRGFPPGRPAAVEHGVFLVMPLGPESDSARRDGNATNTSLGNGVPTGGTGFFYGVVSRACGDAVLGAGRTQRTVVCDPMGGIIASARGDGETIVYADVPLEGVPPRRGR